jgi:hypothetical protein
MESFGPSAEECYGSFRVVPGGDYLSLPLTAVLRADGAQWTLKVTVADLDRLESLTAAEGEDPWALLGLG